jgi:hypothetical protein
MALLQNIPASLQASAPATSRTRLRTNGKPAIKAEKELLLPGKSLRHERRMNGTPRLRTAPGAHSPPQGCIGIPSDADASKEEK